MTVPADPAAARRKLPGDPPRADEIARMLRVDHAGEYGAVRIYAGQLAVLGHTKAGEVVRRMAAQEQRHLDEFDKLLPAHRVRPTALAPLWHVAGFALGAASALIGERAAMACTVAVEEVIDEHYANQVERLGPGEASLKARLEEFRRDEIAHRDEAVAHGAHEAPAYPLLSAAIKSGSRLAIWLSTRI